jgi:dipeptidyl aminopeptidase/acylaminoacyl peptidase
MRRPIAIAALLLGWAATTVLAGPQSTEQLPDGSTGQAVSFQGSDGTSIPAYTRRPKGAGPFPVVVILHGGAPDAGITYALGHAAIPPIADFIAAGWAVMVIDYHANPTVPSTDREDAMAAIEAARRLTFVDSSRVALFGGSHGGNVISRIVSRVDVRCAVMCAPAVLDLIEISRAIDRGGEVAGVLKKMVAAAQQKYGAPLAQVANDPVKYGYESALLEAARVRCPVMIINGRNDTSAPIAVSQAYVDKLQAAGKEVETYFPDNGLHGFYFGFLGNRGSGKPADVTPETREAARRAAIFIRRHFAE